MTARLRRRKARPVRWAWSIALVACLVAPSIVVAQDPPAPEATEAVRQQAQERFFRGLTLYRERAWDAALSEFMESRRLHPTRAATRNAALCLRKLGRYDEALALFEALLRDFADIPPDERVTIEKEAAETRALIGRLEVRVLTVGAVVMIDGVERGAAPLASAITVPAGSHVVQVYKEGYLPVSARVEVAGGRTAAVDLELRPLGVSGRLRVLEQRGQPADVLVDGIVVGRAPWEGALAVGPHAVVLRGAGVFGSQPASAPVRLGELTAVTLVLEPLESTVVVTPTPIGATVVLDGVSVGRGVWEGRVRAGRHKIEVAMDGYLPAERVITLASNARQQLGVELERDRTSPLWASKIQPRFVFSAQAGPAIAPAIGGDVASDGCDDACDAGIPFGGLALLHAGYQLPSGIGFGLELGYLRAWQTVEGRTTSLKERPDALREDAGRSTEQLSMGGMLLGAFGSVQLGTKWTATARIGAGVLLGSASDTRSGTYAPASGAGYDVPSMEETEAARFVFASPEVRIGHRIGRAVEVSAGLQGVFLLGLDEPRWTNERDVTTREFFGFYGEESMTSAAVLFVSPTIGVRVDL